MSTARAALAVALLLGSGPAGAAVLKVGPNEALKGPWAASKAAKDGDTIEIAPGEYYGCGAFYQNRLTITGPSDPATPAVLTDTTCQGKAILVIAGADVTVRHLTLTRARVMDGNGAGIRAEGKGLTVSNIRFVNNQSGILSAPQPNSTIAVLDSVFERNGTTGERCVPTLDIGTAGRLVVERSVFLAPRGCDVLRARGVGRTEVIDSRFEDGPAGAVRHLVVAEDGGGGGDAGPRRARGWGGDAPLGAGEPQRTAAGAVACGDAGAGGGFRQHGGARGYRAGRIRLLDGAGARCRPRDDRHRQEGRRRGGAGGARRAAVLRPGYDLPVAWARKASTSCQERSAARALPGGVPP